MQSPCGASEPGKCLDDCKKAANDEEPGKRMSMIQDEVTGVIVVSSRGAFKADVRILSSTLSDMGNNWRIWGATQSCF